MKAFFAALFLTAGLLCPCAHAQQDEATQKQFLEQKATADSQAFNSPESRAAMMAIGEALRSNGLKSLGDASASPDWSGALKCAKTLIAKYPEFAKGYFDLGTVYKNMGFTDEAVSAFQQQVKLDPSNSAPWCALARIYQDKGTSTQADYAYSQAIELCRKETETAPAGESKLRLLTVLGGIYRDARKPDEAVRAYQEVTREHGKNYWQTEAWQNLARIYSEQGFLEKAVEAMHNGMSDKRYSEAWGGVAGFFLDTKEKKGNDALFDKCNRISTQLKAQGK